MEPATLLNGHRERNTGRGIQNHIGLMMLVGHVGNTPFRLVQQNQHEGGIASPMIVAWSGLKTKAGSVTDQPAHLIDFMATCVDVTGASYPVSYQGREITPLQGRSLLPIFSGLTREPHPGCTSSFPTIAPSEGKHEGCQCKGRPWELYDLSTDRTELQDMSKESPRALTSMKDLWLDVAKNVENAPANLRKPVGQTGKSGKTLRLRKASDRVIQTCEDGFTCPKRIAQHA